jgi:hypothetical protein
LHKLKTELEKTYESLEKKNELLMNAMMKDFGKTQQELPNFKLPDIPQGSAKKPSLFEMPDMGMSGGNSKAFMSQPSN